MENSNTERQSSYNENSVEKETSFIGLQPIISSTIFTFEMPVVEFVLIQVVEGHDEDWNQRG